MLLTSYYQRKKIDIRVHTVWCHLYGVWRQGKPICGDGCQHKLSLGWVVIRGDMKKAFLVGKNSPSLDPGRHYLGVFLVSEVKMCASFCRFLWARGTNLSELELLTCSPNLHDSQSSHLTWWPPCPLSCLWLHSSFHPPDSSAYLVGEPSAYIWLPPTLHFLLWNRPDPGHIVCSPGYCQSLLPSPLPPSPLYRLFSALLTHSQSKGLNAAYRVWSNRSNRTSTLLWFSCFLSPPAIPVSLLFLGHSLHIPRSP